MYGGVGTSTANSMRCGLFGTSVSSRRAAPSIVTPSALHLGGARSPVALDDAADGGGR